MAINSAGTATISFRGDWSKLNSELAAQGELMSRQGSTLGKTFAKGLAAGVAGAGAIAVAAGKKFTDFNQQMTLVQTQAGASAKEVKALTSQVLELSKKTGEFSPNEMAKGLFRVESAGFRGQKAMQVLTDAVHLAEVGQSDLESTTYALTAAMKSGIKGAEDSATAVGTLNAAVGLGNMHMQDLIGAMGTGILISAKQFGLSLMDVTSALDLMTRKGMGAEAVRHEAADGVNADGRR